MPRNTSKNQISSPEWLAKLTHRRWSLPVLAELWQHKGCKMIWLERHLGAGRGPAKDALNSLIELGLVTPNPGQGHPMRPEYILTKIGKQIAEACAELLEELSRVMPDELGFKKWTLPVLFAVENESTESSGCRFGQVCAQLPSATPRAISQTLQELEEVQLVVRTITASRPPRPEYRTESQANELTALLQRVTGQIVGK